MTSLESLAGQYADLGAHKADYRTAAGEEAGYMAEIGYVKGMGVQELKNIIDVETEVAGALELSSSLLNVYEEGQEFQESKELIQESLASLEAESEYDVSGPSKDVHPKLRGAEYNPFDIRSGSFGTLLPEDVSPWESLSEIEREYQIEPFLAKHEVSRVPRTGWDRLLKERKYMIGEDPTEYSTAEITAAGKWIRAQRLFGELEVGGSPLMSYMSGYGE